MKKKEMSLEKALELLGAKDLPDTPRELEELRQWVSKWVERHSTRLLEFG
jgi:hypothetical protein